MLGVELREVLVVGSGAREHALVWKLAMSRSVDTIYCAPGNGGTALLAQNIALPISTEAECDQLAGWAFNNKMDLVIIGPEGPLSNGVVDTLMMFGVPVVGGPRSSVASTELLLSSFTKIAATARGFTGSASPREG